jgi:site-specific DNA recombinase
MGKRQRIARQEVGGTGTRRAAVYVRVSSDDQVEGYSLDAQVRAGEAYCTQHGWEPVLYREEGRSARTDDETKRPVFRQLLTDAERHVVDVIIVHKLDRFARNRRIAFDAFERLGKAGVGFVSLSEQMDYTSPAGQLMLTMLVGLSQFYSDNLAFETKKGKAERKAQGLYNGLLPFGLKKGPEQIPVPDPATYPGLLLAFQLAGEGRSDREVAEALNTAGYRTTGNRGPNLFTKDTVCRLLKNRFYLGELPDGNGGWMRGVHQPVLDEELFTQAQRARTGNRTRNSARVNQRHRRYALSGLAVCGTCGGRLHIHTARNGRARIYCYQERQGAPCGQRSTFLDGIEEQLAAFLGTFRLPEDTIAELLARYERLTDEQDDTEQQRRQVTGRLERMKDLYTWGDLTREAYLTERDQLEQQLARFQGTTDRVALLRRVSIYLQDVPAAWEAATPEQRNALARTVLQSVEIRDDRVTAVVPQPEFAPFFNLVNRGNESMNDEGQPCGAAPNCQSSALAGGSDGDRSVGCILPIGALLIALRPPLRVAGRSKRATYRSPRQRKLSVAQVEAIRAEAGNRSLRELAAAFGVSHETVRAALREALPVP